MASHHHIVVLLSLKTALLNFSTAAVYSIKINLNSKSLSRIKHNHASVNPSGESFSIYCFFLVHHRWNISDYSNSGLKMNQLRLYLELKSLQVTNGKT